jgi:uncharacterized protein (TIGR04255 family)
MPQPLEIRVGEDFEHLKHAPISEAVMAITCRPGVSWNESEISPRLKELVKDYPRADSQKGMQHEFKFGPGGTASAPNSTDLGWRGLQFKSPDGLQIAGFFNDTFLFSRQPPYQSWTLFLNEALRLWEIHAAIAAPTEIQRIGLRYINQVGMEAGLKIHDYFRSPPQGSGSGLDLPMVGFFHQGMFSVLGHPYLLNVIRTIQPGLALPGVQFPQGRLILDIDVSINGPQSLEKSHLVNSLAEMHWLKNKIFFGNFTKKALLSFR